MIYQLMIISTTKASMLTNSMTQLNTMGRTKKLLEHMQDNDLCRQLHFEEQEYLHYIRRMQKKESDIKNKQQ